MSRLRYWRPDKWAIIEVLTNDGLLLHKVLAGWHGGFLKGDYWRINSGISRVDDSAEELVLHGYSGSTYFCHKSAYGTTALSKSVLQDLTKRAEAEGVQIILLDEQTALSLRWFHQAAQPHPQDN